MPSRERLRQQNDILAQFAPANHHTLAAPYEVTPGQFAFAWVLNNKFVTAAIGGPRTEEQWEDYAGALECRLGPRDEALIDRLVSPGHPSTPGYNDPSYPLEGRVPRG